MLIFNAIKICFLPHDYLVGLCYDMQTLYSFELETLQKLIFKILLNK